MSRYRVLESEPGRRVAGVLVLLVILAFATFRLPAMVAKARTGEAAVPAGVQTA